MHKPGVYLDNNLKKFNNIAIDECKIACEADAECRSIEFLNNGKGSNVDCHLSKLNIATAASSYTKPCHTLPENFNYSELTPGKEIMLRSINLVHSL